MRRLLSLSVLALVGLSACDTETLKSPLAPEVPAASFAKADLPAFEPPTDCPAVSCIIDPTVMVRGKKAPTNWVREFTAEEGQEAELVVFSSNPKTTTVKAWLNDEMVLLPSAMPKSGSNEIRIPLTLAEENVLELRMSAKPGTQVSFWVEGGVTDPTEPPPPPPDPEPTIIFNVTPQSVPITADMNAECVAAFGDGFATADWTDVVAAVEGGMAEADILEFGYAFVLNNGIGTFSVFMMGTYHYMLSAIGDVGTNYGSVGSDLTLNAYQTDLPVLCIGPST